MARMLQLPDEITKHICELACCQVHNGAASSYGMIIIVQVESSSSLDSLDASNKSNLEEWMYRKIEIVHRKLDPHSTWRFICEVRTNNIFEVCIQFDRSSKYTWDSIADRYPLFNYDRHTVPKHAVIKPSCEIRALLSMMYYSENMRDIRGDMH